MLGKDQKCIAFYGYKLIFAFRPSGIEDNRMPEEKAENAEIVP